MRELLRVTLARHRTAAAACALVTAVVGLTIGAMLPERWRVHAEVYVHEPIAMHRIANPFAAAPREREGLAELPEELTSRERLVAMVKRTGLMDQWEASRPLPMRLKDRVMEAVRGPVPEKDLLDALVAMLEKKLDVTVTGDRVKISVEWTSRQAAFGLGQAVVSALTSQRESRDVKALDAAARSLDEQLAGVRAELTTRAAGIEAAMSRAAAEGRRASVDADREQLMRDQLRAAELLMRAEEKHIGAEVMRRSNVQRFVVVKPPLLPRQPEGPGTVLWLLIVLVVSAISGAAGALALSIAGGQLMSGAHVTRTLGVPVLGAMQVEWSGLSERPRRAAVVLVAGMALATGVALGISRGNVALAVAPIVAIAGAWQLWTRPLKWPLLALLLAAVTFDDPTDRPYYKLWQSPLYLPGRFLFTNVAWFTGFELCVMGLFALMFVRRVFQAGQRALALDPVGGQAPRALRLALVLSGLTVAWLIVLGVARGGNFREALWQFRAPLMMPFVCTLALYAFDFPRDLKWLAGVLAIGTVVKSLLGTYFIYRVALPMAEYPPHTTGHNDTMIFVTASVFCFLLVWEKPTWRHIGRAMGLMLFAAMAMRLNDRRIAYVDIAMALVFVYLVSPRHAMKRLATQIAVALLPVVFLYFVAGWNAPPRGIFRPVQKVRSIIAPAADTEEESSNVERDIENYNITKSWEQNMFIGQGFGHAFHEYTPSNDFSQSRFGHIGHNSILWMLWIGGVLGFTGVLLYLAVAAYLIGRTLKRVGDWRERVALLVALSILLTYLMQAFGDMGMLSMQFDFFVGVAVALAGRLATRYRAMDVPPALLVRPEPAADGELAQPA